MRTHYAPSFGALAASCLVALGILGALAFKLGLSHPTRDLVFALLLLSTSITFGEILFQHTVIILRPSSEPSPLRQELLHKFPLVAISSALTFLLTLLGLYLKHKYWP